MIPIDGLALLGVLSNCSEGGGEGSGGFIKPQCWVMRRNSWRKSFKKTGVHSFALLNIFVAKSRRERDKSCRIWSQVLEGCNLWKVEWCSQSEWDGNGENGSCGVTHCVLVEVWWPVFEDVEGRNQGDWSVRYVLEVVVEDAVKSLVLDTTRHLYTPRTPYISPFTSTLTTFHWCPWRSWQQCRSSRDL